MTTPFGWDEDDLLERQIETLPDDVQRRIWALERAVDTFSMLKPRMHRDEALAEILSMAEEFVDESYGGRQARLEAMPYPEYLKTPEWDEKRRAAYRKADYRCQLCNASGTELHAHHRSYSKRSKEGEEEDLIVLCRLPRAGPRVHLEGRLGMGDPSPSLPP